MVRGNYDDEWVFQGVWAGNGLKEGVGHRKKIVLREKQKKVAEGVFRDNSTKNHDRLFHATLPGHTGEALGPAVNGKQDESLPIQ